MLTVACIAAAQMDLITRRHGQRKSVQNLKSSKTDDCNKLKQPANFVSYRKDISMHAKCSTVDQYKTVSGLTETHAKPSPGRKGSPARVCKARY
jgi:hypothetical protein